MEIITDNDLRGWIARDFTDRCGGSRLARALGVSIATASVLRGGGGALVKVAAYYGYVRIPGQPGLWRRSACRIRPQDVGYKNWSLDVQLDIRHRLKEGQTLTEIAVAHHTNAELLRRAIKRHSLNDPAGLSLHYKLGAAECRLRGDTYGERRIRAEQEARAAGGTFSQQIAHMQHLLMSDEDRRRFHDELQELINAAA